MKNADFYAEFKYENEQQRTFHKKITSKRRVNNQAIHAFTHTRLFSTVSHFFWWNFFATFSKVLHSV